MWGQTPVESRRQTHQEHDRVIILTEAVSGNGPHQFIGMPDYLTLAGRSRTFLAGGWPLLASKACQYMQGALNGLYPTRLQHISRQTSGCPQFRIPQTFEPLAQPKNAKNTLSSKPWNDTPRRRGQNHNTQSGRFVDPPVARSRVSVLRVHQRRHHQRHGVRYQY